MKVKIAYTVDLDEIPSETVKMLGNISPKIDKFSKVLANCKKQIALDDITNAIKSLEEMNNSMYECSIAVADCYSILTDYVATKYSKPEAPNDATEEG